MLLLVWSLILLRSPTLRSRQSSSFALPELGMVCGYVSFQVAFYVASRGYNRAPMKTMMVVVRRMTA